jgi:hypothetical protein
VDPTEGLVVGEEQARRIASAVQNAIDNYLSFFHMEE